jgi:pantoate--beta-alanine ligase
MGALHQGHASLIRRARRENDAVVASIFVNPSQFGPREDFRKYPRDLKKDTLFCRRLGVDYIFYPSALAMYPKDFRTRVYVPGHSDVLCGESRSGHFQGVAGVVAKLLNIVQPDIAYFGQKDTQQAVIIQRMALDLNIPVEIKVLPTVRESNGLALSSRNRYLNPAEKRDALVLSESLRLASKLIKGGTRDSRKIIQAMRQLIRGKKSSRIDYVSIVDLDNLRPLETVSRNALIALAVWVGKTRLIDNIIIRDGCTSSIIR